MLMTKRAVDPEEIFLHAVAFHYAWKILRTEMMKGPPVEANALAPPFGMLSDGSNEIWPQQIGHLLLGDLLSGRYSAHGFSGSTASSSMSLRDNNRSTPSRSKTSRISSRS